MTKEERIIKKVREDLENRYNNNITIDVFREAIKKFLNLPIEEQSEIIERILCNKIMGELKERMDMIWLYGNLIEVELQLHRFENYMKEREAIRDLKGEEFLEAKRKLFKKYY